MLTVLKITFVEMAKAGNNSFLPYINWKSKDIYGVFMTFRRRRDLYFKVKKIPREEQADHILLYGGPHLQQMPEIRRLTDEDMEDPDKV